MSAGAHVDPRQQLAELEELYVTCVLSLYDDRIKPEVETLKKRMEEIYADYFYQRGICLPDERSSKLW